MVPSLSYRSGADGTIYEGGGSSLCNPIDGATILLCRKPSYWGFQSTVLPPSLFCLLPILVYIWAVAWRNSS